MKPDQPSYPFPPRADGVLPAKLSGAEHISELSAFWLRIECPEHGQALVPLRLLSAKIGWKVPLRSAVARLRCKHCGGLPSKVSIIDTPDGDGHSVARGGVIVLVDRGSAG